MNARPVSFRFGLRGRRWGDAGPVVLMLHGSEAMPWTLAQLIEPLLDAGRQVIALDDPTDAALDDEARAAEYGSAAEEAAVEIRELESIVGHGLGAAAAAKALAHGLPAQRSALLASNVLLAEDEILDSLLEREPHLPLAA